ncbi:hypothetical protein ABZP36_030924 [Zizania latifolia]
MGDQLDQARHGNSTARHLRGCIAPEVAAGGPAPRGPDRDAGEPRGPDRDAREPRGPDRDAGEPGGPDRDAEEPRVVLRQGVRRRRRERAVLPQEPPAGAGHWTPLGILGRRHSVLLAAADSEEEDGEEESVASWGVPEDCFYGNFSDTLEEDGACSSGDSSLLRRAMDRCGGVFDDEVTSQLS